jgi:hypothetical protein
MMTKKQKNSTLLYYCLVSTARCPITDTAEHTNMNNKEQLIGHYETNKHKQNKQTEECLNS